MADQTSGGPPSHKRSLYFHRLPDLTLTLLYSTRCQTLFICNFPVCSGCLLYNSWPYMFFLNYFTGGSMQWHLHLTHFLFPLVYLKASVKPLGLPDFTHTFSNCAGGHISLNPLLGGVLAVALNPAGLAYYLQMTPAGRADALWPRLAQLWARTFITLPNLSPDTELTMYCTGLYADYKPDHRPLHDKTCWTMRSFLWQWLKGISILQHHN